MTDTPVIAVTEALYRELLPGLERHGTLLLDDAPDAALAGCRVLVCGGDTTVDGALMDRMPALGLIAGFAAGYEGIDLAAARARGIAVTHADDANSEDVADLAIGLIVAHRRGILAFDRAVRDGRWRETRERRHSLGGVRLGIVGLGAIGRAVARRGAVMRMEIAWWGPRAKSDALWRRTDSLVDLAGWSDVLVVAAAANDDNHGLVSAAVIAALGGDGLLVNVSRGRLIDEDALIAALGDGTLGGAALDVFAEEPTPPERWQGVPNTLFTTHVGGATFEAVVEMARQCVGNIEAFLAGEALASVVG